jgi:hypothetical protein
VIREPRDAFFREYKDHNQGSMCPARWYKLGLNRPRIIVLSGSRDCENAGMRCVEVWR